ncbi:MAG: UDP-2,4-diacetamido-2,4,6-trideoxy-beta-L-altropyranose hydrolase [Pseudomonadota bacterium]
MTPSQPRKILFRVDSSQVIGTGHVMRCVMLARQLASQGAQCHFICADLPGHLGDEITGWGFGLILMAATGRDRVSATDYSTWSGLPWAEDAALTQRALSQMAADWLVVDHYGLEARWEEAVLAAGTRCLVMDDLANRPHMATILVDPVLGREEETYRPLVPKSCTLLLGPRYALLRPEFAELRETALKARVTRPLHRILISMGGVDLPNATGEVLNALGDTNLARDLDVTVVLGRTSPHLDQVKAQARALPFDCKVAVDVADMHERMAQADLAIGAAGGTAWERCVLGLPTLMLTIADNQVPGANALDKAGAAIYLGSLHEATWPTALADSLLRLQNPDALAAMSKAASSLCDGRGADRLAQAVLSID